MSTDSAAPVDVLAGLPELDRDRLRRASVLIAGAGNIGSPLASFIARSGICLLKVVDRDTVEAKNVATQDYRLKDVGRSKAAVLAERLRAQLPGLAVEPYRLDLRDFPLGRGNVDLILGALDSRLARQTLVSEIAWPLGIPVVDGGVGEGLRGRVQVFVPNADTACLECGWGTADYRLLAAEYPCVPGADAEAPSTAAPAFLGAAVASVMAAEAIRVLGGEIPAEAQEIAFDLFHRRHLVTRLRRNPRCRFDHEVVRDAVVMEPEYARATAADLLALVERRCDGRAFHLECKRLPGSGNAFVPGRLIDLDWLRSKPAWTLAQFGFSAADRVRVRTAEGSFFVVLECSQLAPRVDRESTRGAS